MVWPRKEIADVINQSAVEIGIVLVESGIVGKLSDIELWVQLGDEAVDGIAQGCVLSAGSLEGKYHVRDSGGGAVEDGNIRRVAWIQLGLDSYSGRGVAREDCVEILTSALPVVFGVVAGVVALEGGLRRETVGSLQDEDLHESEVRR